MYTGVDIFRLLAAIGIISIHTNVPWLSRLGRLGVPFFIIISMYFFFNHYLRLELKEEKRDYLKKFDIRLITLFSCWQLLYLPFWYKSTKSFFIIHSISIKSIGIYFFDFLFRISPTDINGWFPSWYLMAMILGVPVFLGLLKVFNSHLIFLGMVCILIECCYIAMSEFGFILHISDSLKSTFPRIFIYAYIGLITSKYFKKIKKFGLSKNLLLFIILLILFLIENIIIYNLGGKYSSDETLLTAPTGMLLTWVSLLINPNIGKKLSLIIRRCSVFLYCVQVWSIWVTGKFIILNSKPTYKNIAFFIVVIIFGLIVYTGVSALERETNSKFIKRLM